MLLEQNGRSPTPVDIPPSGSGRDMFPNALCPRNLERRARLPLTTLRESLMLQFMNEVTDKLNRDVKV
jgi:hypothetical protein